MTSVGIFGLILGLMAAFIAFIRPTRFRVAVFCFAYLMHVAATLGYYELVKNGGADAALYYYDPYNVFGTGLELNTTFVIYLVQWPKSWFGGTYLDYFLLFQAVGFFGVAYLMRTFEEIYHELDAPQPLYTYALLFIPSLHYWTAAIGKDSLFFFGICISLWASMQYKKRWFGLALGMLLMLAIRPHIAAIAAAAFTVAVLVDKRTSIAMKVPLFGLSLAGTAYAVATVWSTFQVDLTNIDTYSDMLSGQEALAESESAGGTAVQGSYPVRLLSLLFRPLFFDANGALGLIVSVENLILLIIFALMAAHLRTTWLLARKVPFIRYALVSSLVITLGLAMGYYNVGLGIRQKATMILPGILVAFVAIQALRGARRAAAEAEPVPVGQPSFG